MGYCYSGSTWQTLSARVNAGVDSLTAEAPIAFELSELSACKYWNASFVRFGTEHCDIITTGT